MPDITDSKCPSVQRLHPFFTVVTSRGCLYCNHTLEEHTGTAAGVYREGREYRKFVLHAVFCDACAAEKGADQATCWQMPKRLYLNFGKYGVEF